MRAVFFLAVLSLVAACDKTVPTPAGTTLADVPSFTKLSVSSWTLGQPKGPMTKVTKTYRYDPGAGGKPVSIKLSFEHGPVAFVAAPSTDKPDTVDAVAAIHLEVIDNAQWKMSATCDDNLAVPLAVKADGTAAYPTDLWASCSLVMKRSNGDMTELLPIEIHSSGKVDVRGTASDERVVEE
jgi:hypothetical protein